MTPDQSTLVDDTTPLGRMKIFAAETQDYTIRAAQIRPDILALIERLSSEDGVTEEMIEAGWQASWEARRNKWDSQSKLALKAIYLAMLKARKAP